MKQPTICGIYMIEALAGNPERVGWKYIGQSVDCLYRLKKHFEALKYNRHHNPKLQSFFNKYGQDSLKFSILSDCPKTELNFWEKWFIKSFDSVLNGFNCTEGGENPPDLRKSITMQNMVDGRIESFASFSDFAERYGLSVGKVSEVVNEKKGFVKDWFCPKNKWKPKIYKVINPGGKEFSVTKTRLFCNNHNIRDISSFNSLLKGRRYSHQGWKLAGRKRKFNEINYSNFKLLSPTGKIIEGRNLSQFARENNLTQPNLNSVILGNRKSCKGWTLYKEVV